MLVCDKCGKTDRYKDNEGKVVKVAHVALQYVPTLPGAIPKTAVSGDLCAVCAKNLDKLILESFGVA